MVDTKGEAAGHSGVEAVQRIGAETPIFTLQGNPCISGIFGSHIYVPFQNYATIILSALERSARFIPVDSEEAAEAPLARPMGIQIPQLAEAIALMGRIAIDLWYIPQYIHLWLRAIRHRSPHPTKALAAGSGS